LKNISILLFLSSAWLPGIVFYEDSELWSTLDGSTWGRSGVMRKRLRKLKSKHIVNTDHKF